MRIENPRYIERFGSVKIHEVQRVIEFDSGKRSALDRQHPSVRRIADELIREVEGRMAIVLPIRNESTRLLEGVLSAIPHDCTIILVSNSQTRKLDRFRAEREVMGHFCRLAQREAYIVHQKDRAIAQRLRDAGYVDILGDDGLVRDGKCEGMIIGILMAGALEKEFVGFIDADNYIPGSVWEYATNYAAGFTIASSPYSMVRILWRYKHQVRGEYRGFRRWGRVSKISNEFLDALISTHTGFDPDIIKTACAGEHAMSLRLAEILPFASGYAIESYELAYILEKFGGLGPIADASVRDRGVEIFQIETKNPHLHESRKDEEHLTRDLLLPVLSVIYHSPLCDDVLKQRVREMLISLEVLRPEEELPRQRIYPPIRESIDLAALTAIVKEHLPSYSTQSRRRNR